MGCCEAQVGIDRRCCRDCCVERNPWSIGRAAHWGRRNEASNSTMGYLLGSIHQRIKNRPDVLENILFDGLEQKLRGRQLVGYTIAEIKARTTA